MFVDFVRVNNFQCRHVDLVRRCILDRCFEVRCDLQWTYEVREFARGGYYIVVK
ncbi:hypothetical protein UAJ10_15135 [Nitrospirillum sp. BR 11164]|uniref:hypothetical protein n=1 Tax=Nitrospirillum sp. BR 11164 TaxID=3104324 RepID=UPI002AFE2001|nr:hypothetical protein [Nitrospirillum sp. BR 11164]MEA1650339.1 hypothetical protein [Nitrospirillum sp. BR 11164]